MLETEYSGKIFTSDTADKEIELLRDINKALANIQFVIFTSKVTTGCDHTRN